MAIGVGWMCTLATGVSFSMLTLAFAQLLYAISFKWTSVTGGSGTLIGPVLGAAFFMLMEHQLSAWTEAWALYFGLIFIAFVLFAPQGIWGLAATRLRRADPNPWPRP
jgi:ABC-type branched-subunit amino acid transport system permease subunit